MPQPTRSTIATEDEPTDESPTLDEIIARHARPSRSDEYDTRDDSAE